MVLVDTNVLLDVFQDDTHWAAWSQHQIDAGAATDSLAINPVIYAELSISFARIEELDTVIEEADLQLEAVPKAALFLAGKAFLACRKSQGSKQTVLPDFFIGAHAAIMGWSLLTRDVNRYRTYFPTVNLIAP